jgi:hypothetical protein
LGFSGTRCLGDTETLNQASRASEIAAQGRRDLEHSVKWRSIQQEFYATGRAETVQRALSEAIDAAAVEAYQSALAPILSGPAAMIAAGDLARNESFP